MTISDVASRVIYATNGSTTEFAVPFQFFELEVYLDGVLQAVSSYTVTQAALGSSGSVVFPVAPASGKALTLKRNTTAAQETNYVEGDDFPAASHEAALDRLTMVVQEIKESISELDLPEDNIPDILSYTENPNIITVVDGKPYLTPVNTLLSAGQFTLIGRGHNVGDVVIHVTPDVPVGWIRIKRDPQAVLKSAYPEYDAVCSAAGYPYGSTPTHVNVPGGAGLFPRIWDDTSTLDPDAASRLDHATGATVVGNVIGSRQVSTNKSHTHGMNAGGAHSHAIKGRSNLAGGGGSFHEDPTGTDFGATEIDGQHSHILLGEGGNEARPANVAWPFIMLISPGSAAASYSSFGIPLSFNTSTVAGNPGVGKIALNNANPALATILYAANTQGYSADIAASWARYNSLPSGLRGTVTAYTVNNLGVYFEYDVTGAVDTSDPNYVKIPVTYVSHAGTMPNDAKLSVVPLRAGPAGAAGADGSDGLSGTDGGIRWNFDASTVMGDPGSGLLRLNNPASNAVTALAVSKSSGEMGAPATGPWLLTFDDSTNITSKGTITLKRTGAAENYAVYRVTGAVVDNGTWIEVPVAHESSAGALAATLSLQFARSGDKGSDGTGSGDVSAAAAFGTDNRILVSDGTAKGVKASLLQANVFGGLHCPADIRLTGIISPTSLAADVDNYAPTNNAIASVWRIAASAARQITGISGGADGRLLLLENTSNFTITLVDESASTASAAENRFLFGSSLVLLPKEATLLIYDGVSARWRTLSSPKAIRSNKTDNITVGYTATETSQGTIGSGTLTPVPSLSNFSSAINGGAHTLAAPTTAGSYTMVVQYTNNATAGAITFSGFSKVTGDTLTTTNGDDYLIFITKVGAFVHAHKQLLQ